MFGIVAAACQHVLITPPNIVGGNQQTAHIMEDDILKAAADRQRSELGGAGGTRLGVAVDAVKLAKYHDLYLRCGQILPYDPVHIGKNATVL